MLPTLVPIGALLSGIALLLLGSGLVNTVIPLRGSLEGFSANTLGLIGSTYFLGFFLGTFIAPRLIRRMGHIRAFAFFGATVASCILLHTLIVDAGVWMGLRVLTGVGLVGFYAVIESWLNDQTAAERRGQVFAIYMVVNLAALAGAQQLLRLDTPAAFTLFAVAAIFVCLSLLPVTMTRLPQPQIGARPRLDLGLIWRAAPAAFVGALSSGLSMGAFWSLTPLYAEGIGLDAAGVGLLMSTAIIGGALLQWPMGRFSDAGDRRLALAVAAIGRTPARPPRACIAGRPVRVRRGGVRRLSHRGRAPRRPPAQGRDTRRQHWRAIPAWARRSSRTCRRRRPDGGVRQHRPAPAPGPRLCPAGDLRPAAVPPHPGRDRR